MQGIFWISPWPPIMTQNTKLQKNLRGRVKLIGWIDTERPCAWLWFSPSPTTPRTSYLFITLAAALTHFTIASPPVTLKHNTQFSWHTQSNTPCWHKHAKYINAVCTHKYLQNTTTKFRRLKLYARQLYSLHAIFLWSLVTDKEAMEMWTGNSKHVPLSSSQRPDNILVNKLMVSYPVLCLNKAWQWIHSWLRTWTGVELPTSLLVHRLIKIRAD